MTTILNEHLFANLRHARDLISLGATISITVAHTRVPTGSPRKSIAKCQ
jgi:hypothetical protein